MWNDCTFLDGQYKWNQPLFIAMRESRGAGVGGTAPIAESAFPTGVSSLPLRPPHPCRHPQSSCGPVVTVAGSPHGRGGIARFENGRQRRRRRTSWAARRSRLLCSPTVSGSRCGGRRQLRAENFLPRRVRLRSAACCCRGYRPTALGGLRALPHARRRRRACDGDGVAKMRAFRELERYAQ